MTCPKCRHQLTEAEIISAFQSLRASKQTPHAGPGRPRTEKRCPCGAMTVKRAEQRKHACHATSN